MIQHLIFALNILTLVFLLAGASYFYKQKRFENEHIDKTTKLLTGGIVLLATATLINIIHGFQTYFDINYFFQNLGMKLVDLVYVNEFAILPLAGLSFLAAMIILKKHL
ncbi:MAG: hypothetical protein ISS23_03225 [Nanoarchaeota archaeon]|nr:hypothetical protein [Nanoarchaeota archaeon]